MNISQVLIEIASSKDFDNLVAEVEVPELLLLIVSKEPGDEEFFLSVYNLGASDAERNAAAYSSPQDGRRYPLEPILRALLEARDALKG